MMEVKYPSITVKLTETDGNIFNILGIVTKALKTNKVPPDQINNLMNEVMASDSFHEALGVVMKWVNVN